MQGGLESKGIAKEDIATILDQRPIESLNGKDLYRIDTVDGSYALIIKDVYTSYIENPESEIAQRMEAQRACLEALPDYSLANEIILYENGGQSKTIKLVPWIAEAKPFSEIPVLELLSDKEACLAIKRVSEFCLEKLQREGKRFDFLKGEGIGKVPKQLYPLIKMIKSINIFKGKDSSGNEVIFLDSDWFEFASDDSPIYHHAEKTWYRTVVLMSLFLRLHSLAKFK